MKKKTKNLAFLNTLQTRRLRAINSSFSSYLLLFQVHILFSVSFSELNCIFFLLLRIRNNTDRMQVRKQQLELDMEQKTGSKSGKEYIKAIYCHPASLTYMQSTS